MALPHDPRLMLQQLLDQEIPLTRAMGLKVRRCTADGVTLGAPLAPNLNYTGTAFGGSLGAILVLAGWAYLWQLLERSGVEGWVVVQETTTSYLQPVTRDFEASCAAPPAAQVELFVKTLRRWGRARITLEAVVGDPASPAARMRGSYVGFARDTTSPGGG